jgi:hypothetical protein
MTDRDMLQGRILALALAVTLGSALTACGGAGAGPNGTLDRYSRSLKDRDFGGAYELMSSSYRAKVSKEEFVRLMRDNPREVSETADRLSGRRGAVEVSAEFEYGLGDAMHLVQEGGSWRVASNPLGFYDQTTPRSALRSFLRAYRLERWDVMLRFVPDKYREKMDAEKVKGQFQGAAKEQMEELMNTLEANVDEPIIERGTNARMAYGERYEVKFTKENGAWKLQDLD